MIILTILMALLMVVVVPLLVLFVLVSEYVLRGIALSRIAKQTGACKPAKAWIPVIQYQVLGECAEACHEKTEGSGKKPWKWGKIMLIMGSVYLGTVVFILPLALLLAFFGLGILVDAVAWLGIAFSVATSVCAFKIYRCYMDDPYDVIVLILTVMYPGWTSTALLITSFLKVPSKTAATQDTAARNAAPQQPAPRTSDPEDDGAAVIAAESDED